MGIIKEVDIINKRDLFLWDGENSHHSIFEPNFFGEMEKDISFIQYEIWLKTLQWFGRDLGMPNSLFLQVFQDGHHIIKNLFMICFGLIHQLSPKRHNLMK